LDIFITSTVFFKAGFSKSLYTIIYRRKLPTKENVSLVVTFPITTMHFPQALNLLAFSALLIEGITAHPQFQKPTPPYGTPKFVFNGGSKPMVHGGCTITHGKHPLLPNSGSGVGFRLPTPLYQPRN
jgi:hypothetical protein